MRRLAACLCAVAAGLWACATAPDGGTPRLAGSAACRSCHETEHAAWGGSSHAQAARPANAPGVAARFDGAWRRFPSLRFRPLQSDADRRFEIESGDGATTTRDLTYVLGHASVEQFLTPGPGGRWQMLPAGYDPASGEWFDIFPEAPTPRDWAHWTNPGATANSQCLACHMTGYAAGYDAAAETYATTWHEVGVGCEACHGAAGEHVEVRQRGGIDAYGAPDATRPGPGCPLCHDLRVEIAAGWMPDAEPTEHFAPELLDSAAFHADGQPAGEVYEWTSFAMTAMAREGVRCADCHEPHDGRLRQEGNALCLGCHEARLDTTEHTHHPAGSDGAACVGCHMPEQVFMQRDRRRDHRIARPDPALAEAVGAPDACTTCHTDRPQAWATAATARWWGTSGAMQAARDDALALLAGRVGDHIAVAPLVAMVGRLGLDPVRRASAARLLGQWSTEPTAQQALVTATRAAEPLVRAGAVTALGIETGHDAAVRNALVAAATDVSRLVRVEAGFALRGTLLESLDPAARDAVQRAWDAWLAAQRVIADAPGSHFNQGVFWTARGDLARAEASYRTAIRLWAHELPPRQNLAQLLLAAGRHADARRELEAALTESPGWAPAAATLARLDTEEGRLDEAAARFIEVLASDPTHPRVAFDLGRVFVKLKVLDRAAAAFELATRDPASRPEALRELVRVAHERGDVAARDRWLPEALLADPQLATDPRVRDALDIEPAAQP